MTTGRGRSARVRAPELRGAGWTGTAGRDLRLADLRGRVVLLDFWTAGCVHCLHVLDELRPLEAALADVLTVVGVHTPKFDAEGAPGAVAAAVARLGVDHPVLDDADRETWSQYAVRAWPTLVVVDPEGYVVHTASGEGHAAELAEVIAEVAAAADGRGTLRRDPAPARPAPPAASSVSAPAGLAVLPDGGVLLCDGDAVVHLAADLRTVRRRYRGFTAPQGLCLRPDGSAVVADTGAHRLVALSLSRGELTHLAGTGTRRRPGDPTAGPALDVPLSSPWDVAEHDGALVVAMAGTHQLWRLREGVVEVLAGTGAEQLRDGPADRAYLAQPAALASDGDRLWFVDAETSALRWYAGGQVTTAVGTGLFAFGDADGPADDALLQHPLGVAVLPDGAVAVADTYNGSVRRYDPELGQLRTLARGLLRPTGLAVRDGVLLVSTDEGVLPLAAPAATC